ATAGLDLDEAVLWLKKAEPHLAAGAAPAGEISAKSGIRATYVGPHPRPALLHLDELAGQWLYQYLPDRLARRAHAGVMKVRTGVNEARKREDVAQERLEGLRQRQIAEIREQGTGDDGQGTRRPGDKGTRGRQEQAVAGDEVGGKLKERLETLRVQLSHLTG